MLLFVLLFGNVVKRNVVGNVVIGNGVVRNIVVWDVVCVNKVGNATGKDLRNATGNYVRNANFCSAVRKLLCSC